MRNTFKFQTGLYSALLSSFSHVLCSCEQPHHQPRTWRQCSFLEVCGWEAARVVSRVQDPLGLSFPGSTYFTFWFCCWEAACPTWDGSLRLAPEIATSAGDAARLHIFIFGSKTIWVFPALKLPSLQSRETARPDHWPQGRDSSSPRQECHRVPLFLP